MCRLKNLDRRENFTSNVYLFLPLINIDNNVNVLVWTCPMLEVKITLFLNSTYAKLSTNYRHMIGGKV